MKEPLHLTSSVLHKAWPLPTLAALLVLVPHGSAHTQQVPEVHNTKAALASAPTLILVEELRFVPEMDPDTATPPDAYGLKVNADGWLFFMDAPRAYFRPGESRGRAPQVWVFDSEGRFRWTIGQRGDLLNPRALAVAWDSVIVFDFSPPRGGRAPGSRYQGLGR